MNKKISAILILVLVALTLTAAIFLSVYWKKNNLSPQENPAVTIDENYCNQYQPDFCPDGCIVCPPCLECSSIQCRLASSCEAMGFNKDWYQQTKPPSTETTEIANPASVYCKEQEGKLEIRKNANGDQYGVCIFTDKSECEEWAFFKGECGKDKINDCVKQGGYCAEECKEDDGVVYLKGCSSHQVCCMSKESKNESPLYCKDLCGDGMCQEIVCMAIGCPCAESVKNCPQDCQ
jgi:putative hemolysin